MNETVGGFHFFSDFDSGNLAKAVKDEKNPNEFNLWTLPDCANTSYENGNRTWFYFGVKGKMFPDFLSSICSKFGFSIGPSNVTVKFNLMNLNRQAKLYSQGMRPLFKVVPSKESWDRIKEKPVCSVS